MAGSRRTIHNDGMVSELCSMVDLCIAKLCIDEVDQDMVASSSSYTAVHHGKMRNQNTGNWNEANFRVDVKGQLK